MTLLLGLIFWYYYSEYLDLNIYNTPVTEQQGVVTPSLVLTLSLHKKVKKKKIWDFLITYFGNFANF